MYTQYFGLRENPFALPPDPRYLYLSLRHQEALAHLMYGITDGGGFVQLTGEVGTGKTMMIRALLERLPENVDVALILYPFLSVREFVVAILDDLRIEYPKDTDSLKVFIDSLNAYLLGAHAKGRRTVLIIDEAHKLSHEVLEQVRLLTNLETNKDKLLQILLVGQPELHSLLAQPDLRQLAQRITARYNLKSLSLNETGEYVIQRLRVAGAQTPFFSKAALKWVHRLTNGLPRMINVLCDRALLGAYAHGEATITPKTIRRASAELGQSVSASIFARWFKRVAVVGAVGALAVIGWRFGPTAQEMWVARTQPAAPTTQVAMAPAKPAVAEPVVEPVNVAMNTAGDKEAAGEAMKLAKAESKPELRTFEMMLAEDGVASDTESAFNVLFSQWNRQYSEYRGDTGCARAAKAGLRCMFRSGTWNNLRQFNRPAIIELVDFVGNRHHLVVTSIDEGKVTVVIGGKEQTVATSDLDRFWYGKFLLLWSRPEIRPAELRKGARGPGVTWLREALAWQAGYAVPTARKDVFDSVLETQLKEFQRQHQLEADGIAGDMTLLHLNTYNPRVPPPLLTKSNRRGTG